MPNMFWTPPPRQVDLNCVRVWFIPAC